MKNRMKHTLPLLLIILLTVTAGWGVGTAYSKYHYSKGISSISLTVIPLKNSEAETDDAVTYELDTSNVRDLTVEMVDVGTAFSAEGEPSVALRLTPDEGFVLPDAVEVIIGGERYTVSLVQPENNADGFEWIPEERLLLISAAVMPTEGRVIVVYAEAVLEPEETEPEETEPEETEPEETEPEETEPKETEPEETEPEETEPEETEPEETEPEETEPEETEPEETEPEETEPEETEPEETEPEETEPEETEPEETEPEETEPEETEPEEREPE